MDIYDKSHHITLGTYDTKDTFNTLSTHDKNTYSTLRKYGKRDTCNTLATYDTKSTHITLDTNDTCNTLLHGIACYCMVLHGITWYLEFAAYDSSPSYIEQQHASLFFISFVYIIQFLCFCCPNVLFQCSLCVLYVICK